MFPPVALVLFSLRLLLCRVTDVVIDPVNSVLLEVVGAELVHTDQFSAGYVLRFPRVVRPRLDKVSCECHLVRSFCFALAFQGDSTFLFPC